MTRPVALPTEPAGPTSRRSSSTRKAGTSIGPDRRTTSSRSPRPAPGTMPSSPRISASGRDRSRGWRGRLRSWNRWRRIARGAAPAIPQHSLPTRMAGSPVSPRRGSPPRTAGRSRSGRQDRRCARDRRRPPGGRSRLRPGSRRRSSGGVGRPGSPARRRASRSRAGRSSASRAPVTEAPRRAVRRRHDRA